MIIVKNLTKIMIFNKNELLHLNLGIFQRI